MLPLLQQSQRQLSRSLCCLPRLRLQPKRPCQIQAPSFAARPLYMSRRRKACVTFTTPDSIQSSEHAPTSARASPPRKHHAKPAAHPLHSYAALQKATSAPQASMLLPQRHSTSGLRTYAVMAVPAAEERPRSQPNNLHGTLSNFARLSTRTESGTQHQTSGKSAGRGAWKHYAHLRTRS